VKVTGALDREFNVRQDNVTPLDLSVDVPRYQPPSRDAVERQIDADRGLTPAYDTMVDPRGDWDRYRGSVRLFVDDQRTYTKDLDDDPTLSPAARLKPRSWDASLYQLSTGATQFVRWYNEYSGAVGSTPQTIGGVTRSIADLTTGAGGYQHVSVESYAPFDVEFTVGYERRMSIAERFIDFGRAIGGAMSQWVPVTITNEGNVPLYDVKFYVQDPMRAIQVADGASRARGIQLNPIPSWLSSNLAIGAPTERGLIQMFGGGTLSAVFPAAAGSLVGNTVTDVYLRLGRNDLATPLRIPVGQPMGNYAGTLGGFVDNLGTQAADCPNDGTNAPDRAAKTAVGGSAVMKATVTEGPLARVADFFDNETDRRRESANVLNVAPYDATRAQPGTFQPIPDLQFYSEPDVADATPALAVAQDLTTMSNPLPNSSDQLTVFWSRLLDPGGGTNPRWDVWLQRAGRPALAAGQVTSTNYRAFSWPNAPLAGNPQGAAPVGTRNVYPSVCAIPGSAGPDYLVMWHNEADKPAENRRASALQFYRYSGTNRGPLLTVADDASGNGLVNKAMPRAVVDTMNGAGLVAWCAWQNGQGGRARLGFNAISMPAAYGAGAGYADAISVPAGSPVRNYDLRTPPGLTNMAEPWLLPGYRDEATNTAPVGSDPRVGNLRLLNGFYSAWSPLWQNQDIYWTRYRALQDPAESATDNVNTWADGLTNSPMAEDGFRLARTGTAGPVTMDYPATGQTQTLTCLPGGRVPFARITDELLQSTPENVAYGSAHPDWVMPPAQPRLSYCAAASPGVRRVEQVNHKGFADTVLPIVDHDSAGAVVPLVRLRIYAATSLTAGPPDLSTNPTLLTVNFDLPSAMWDAAQEEWVLALANSGAPSDAFATLAARGIKAVRIHPGLGRVTFSAPLYKRGQNNPIYVYASYRPATWRMTTDLAGDTQPTAAFDWWERLTLVWRRGLENGRGQLWYRTFSLSVPLDKPPLTAAPTAMADLDTTPQAITPTLTPDDLRDGMVHLPFDRAGHRVRFTYTYTTDTGTATSTDEYHYVPGLGPERVLPMDGVGSESMPALASEHFLAGYPLGGNQRSIMSGRHWLAWVSTRDLYQLNPTAGNPPLRGKAGTHVYYGAFLPDYTPAAEAR
ncbi:MAG: hypothetical protein HZB16_14340, partial [Armatimonadetes bacterium]|nr:hypothetical protein [Armatimonadota bacterium]